jgi:hypothetical protein
MPNFAIALSYLQTATIPPNLMELAGITKMKDWEAQRAIAFWKEAGLIREVQGEFHHISHLN